MKSVSAVIVIILLLMIVISLTSIAYLFVTGVFTVTTETGKEALETVATSMVSRMAIESIDINKLYIRNTGDTNLTGFAIYINDEPANIDAPSSIAKDEIGSITIYDFIKSGDEIKITTAQGITSRKKAPDPCDKAVLCLNMDEGSGNTTYDSAGHTGNDGVFNGETFNDGTINGATRVDGKYGKALKFDGLDDYVDCGMNDNTKISGPFTLMFWWKRDGTNPSGDRHVIIQKRKTGSFKYNYEAIYDGSNGKMNIGFHDGSDIYHSYGTSCASLNLSEFNHFTLLWTGRFFKIYFNGIHQTPDKDEGVTNPGVGNNQKFVIGARYDGAWGNTNGIIDEVRIYNRSLTESEIQAEMQSSFPITRSIGSWSFEEFGQSVSDTHIWVKGKYGPALSFDGLNDYVNISSASNLNLQDAITITAWIKPSSIKQAAWQSIISRLGWGQSYWFTTVNNDLRFGWNGNLMFITTSGGMLTYNTMQFVAVTYDSNINTTKFFVNGKNVLTNVNGLNGKISTSSSEILIGSPVTSNYWFNGTIDEVRIYNKAIY